MKPTREPSPARRSRPAPPARSGKRLSPDERRAQIIEVAVALFNRRPYADFNVVDVAKAAGITQGLVYHYFPTREALLLAAFEVRAKALLRASLPPADGASVPARIERGVKGYLDFVEAHSVAYLNLFKGPGLSEPAIARICDETRWAFVRHILEGVGLDADAMPAARLALRGYVGFAEAAVLEWLERRAVPRATLERVIYAVILAALRAGVAGDEGSPVSPRAMRAFEAAYKRHFGLA